MRRGCPSASTTIANLRQHGALRPESGGCVADSASEREIPCKAAQVTRKAWPRDIEGSDLSRAAAQVWQQSLCLHRNADNVAWPKVRTIAAECRFSVRTAERGLAELHRNGWIGTPYSDAGGAWVGTAYHLHPDGKCCLRCEEVREHLQRGPRNNQRQRMTNGHPSSEVRRMTEASQTADKVSSRGDKNDAPYEEGTSSIRTLSKEPPTRRAREARTSSRAGDGHRGDNGEDPESERAFQELNELLVGPPLLWKGEMAISKAKEKFGFTWDEFKSQFKSSGLKQAGGLIYLAEHWSQWTKRRAPLPRKVPGKNCEPLFDFNRLRSFLNDCAAQMRRQPALPLQELAARMGILANDAEYYVDHFESLEEQLAAIEREMISAARALVDVEMPAIFKEARNQAAVYSDKMSTDQLGNLVQRYVDYAIVLRLGLPRLSLFSYDPKIKDD